MTQPHPFIEQIDHIGIQARRPRPLFTFFAETLGLPVAFPFTEYPFYTSGSVALGNAFLEIMRFGQGEQDEAPNRADYFILGFLLRAGHLDDTLSLLQQRGIPHSAPVPFFDPQATDDNPVQIWANVYLGHLLGHNLWARLLFIMTRQARPTPSAMRSPLLNRISLGIMRRAFGHGMPVLTEYYTQTEAHARAIGPALLAEQDGGPLSVAGAAEVVVGARDVAPWARFLAPWQPDAGGVYRPDAGPVLRLVPGTGPGIHTLVLRVRSLAQAQAALARRQVAWESTPGRLSVTVPDSRGLTVQLTE